MERIFRLISDRPVLAAAIGLVLIGVPLALAGAVVAFMIVTRPSETIPEPKAVTRAQTSHIYAADGSVLAVFHGEYNRVPVALTKVPKHLQDAVVAAEDARFFEHSGIDAGAIFRALVADLRAGGAVQGGSTITQQYVKNAYVGPRRTIFRKVREARLAQRLEKTLGKREILERYLNTIYFGDGAYGVEAAAKTYFGKAAADLTLSESALLAGIIPAPGRFSPTRDAGAAEIRRLYVLDRMVDEGFVTPGRAETARRERPELAPKRPREEVFSHPWFVDAVRRYLLARYGEEKVFSGGLEVHTTLDPKMQSAAERVLAESLPDKRDPHAALAAVEPETGYIRALVGGRSYGEEKFNIAVQGRRQPGSAFKPFALVAALENGIPAKKTYRGPAEICLEDWKPTCKVRNFDDQGFGTLTLEQATINSVNTVFAQLVLEVGPEKVVEAAGRMGIPGPEWLPRRSGCKEAPGDDCRTRIDPVPALALGAEEVTPLEMASAFATLAADGVRMAPKPVWKVTDASGEELESGPAPGDRALDPEVATRANAILTQVITSGTGRRAEIGRPAAGKTGTAQDFQNAWFVGYTPDLSAAVWMGYKDANRPMQVVHDVANVTGGSIPAQIWAAFMVAALDGVPPRAFTPVPEPPPPTAAEASPAPEESPAPVEPAPPAAPFPSPRPAQSAISPAPAQRPLLCPPIVGCRLGETAKPTPSPSPTPEVSPHESFSAEPTPSPSLDTASPEPPASATPP